LNTPLCTTPLPSMEYGCVGSIPGSSAPGALPWPLNQTLSE
jgi:hypothetical protein